MSGKKKQYNIEYYADHPIRAKFFDMWCKMTGNYIDRKIISGDEDAPLMIQEITRKIIK